MKKEETFWITNISDCNVNLCDLGINIKPRSSVNLLSKHYSFTKEEIIKSATSGYIYKRKDKITVRKIPPIKEKEIQKEISEEVKITRIGARSTVVIEEIKYDELNIPDVEYAKENSEAAEQDYLGKWGNNDNR